MVEAGASGVPAFDAYTVLPVPSTHDRTDHAVQAGADHAGQHGP